MPRLLATGNQTRWKDSCASSVKAGATVIASGEDPVLVYANGQLVPSGITAPTVAATITDAGGGALPAGDTYYCYCYASTQYPNFEAVQTAGGETWPKSNPSPVSASFTNTVSHNINVTVTKTTQAGIDQILIYRVGPDTTGTAAQQAPAGNLNFVGTVGNDGIAGTVTFLDNVLNPQELMEIDNYVAPQFWLTVFAGNRWYGFGNPDLDVAVTLSGTASIVAAAGTFFSGRNGQNVTFDGITTGGYDGQGTYYFKYLSDSVANVSTLSSLSDTEAVPPTGTTTMHVRGFSGTLYRSKVGNPLSWGFTENQNQGGIIVRVPQTFAQPLGAYGVAMIVLPDQQLLKLDMERPSLSVAIDFSADLEANFETAKRVVDTRYIVNAHHSQFLSQLPNGGTAVRGIDTSNFSIVQGDGGNQGPVSSEIFATLRGMMAEGDVGRRFHGVYDTRTELSAFWFKLGNDPGGLLDIDSCFLFHGPTGKWSFLRDFGVTASAAIYDPVQHKTITLLGDASGNISQGFSAGVFYNLSQSEGTVTNAPGFTSYAITPVASGGAMAGTYFDLYLGPASVVRFWFTVFGSGTAPAAPSNGILSLIALSNAQAGNVSSLATVLSMQLPDLGFTGVAADPTTHIVSATAAIAGALVGSNAGTTAFTVTTLLPSTNVTSSAALQVGTNPIGAWAMVCGANGLSEQWGRISQFTGGNQYAFDIWYNPSTNTVSTLPFSTPQIGNLFLVGLINCEAQTYFQASADKSGQPQEMWATIQNVDAANQWGRIYREFDTSTTLPPFQLQRTARQDGNPSDNWSTINIPTTLIQQFGLRIIERGFGAFRILGYTVKGIKPA